tara:strand:- start:166 stop:492 length:327 start_codon:yes stop_codon:yes gene_type:complete
MKICSLNDMTRGWFIGDFDPSIIKTNKYEVGILTHKAGEDWPAHYHKEATEINVLLSGRMVVQGKDIFPNDIFIFEPYEVSDPIFLEDCKVLCVKTPSLPKDKYEVKK